MATATFLYLFGFLMNMSTEQSYIKKRNEGDAVTRTKVSHGKIETAIRVRTAKTKEELDLEAQRLSILNDIDKTTIGENIVLPSELQNWQQLILIIGNLKLKSTTEILLACKRLKYSGKLSRERIKPCLYWKKDYFKFDAQKGWLLTNKGQDEFSRLKQFI